jgi:hypothetical protein
MRKALFVGITALGVVGCLLASKYGNAQTVDQGFATEFVVVMPKSDRMPATVLKRPAHKVKCRSDFLVGECIEEGSWRNGKTVWIAIDEIAEIIEMKSVDEFQEPVAQAPEDPVPVN